MDISYQLATIECPNCHFSIEILLIQVIAEETIICPGCLQDIKLIDEGSSVQRTEQDINDALAELEKTFRDFGRRS